MVNALLVRLLPLVALLLLSAYFSGSEAAFFSLSKLEQDTLRRRSGSRAAGVLDHVASSPDDVLITILTGNMLVNVFASSLGEAIGRIIFPVEGELLSIGAMTILLLLVGEIVPKNIGVRYSLAFARLSAGPLHYLYHGLRPARWFLGLFSRLAALASPSRASAHASAGGKPRHGIIRSAVHIGFKEGILDTSELRLVESFCDFQETEAEEVMIPRTEIHGTDLSAPFDPRDALSGRELLQKAAGSSLVPAFVQDLDHIVGYIALRDVLPLRFGLGPQRRVSDLVRRCLSVPAGKNCADLLLEMREASTEMAVVIDEYGGTAGVITFKSLVEELLGFFYPVDETTLEETGPDTFRAAGNLKIEVLERFLGREVECESRTVAGLIIERLGELPPPGTRLRLDHVEIVVGKIAKNRILEIELRRLPE
jgi:putative hemolysin